MTDYRSLINEMIHLTKVNHGHWPEVILIAPDVYPPLVQAHKPWLLVHTPEGELLDTDTGRFPLIVRASLPAGFIAPCDWDFVHYIDAWNPPTDHEKEEN